MELHKLQNATLKKAIKNKQPNGTTITDYVIEKDYKIWIQGLEDEVSSQIYGANIYRVFKVKSPRRELERYLQSKVNNTEDNISKYFMFIDENIYKVNDAKISGITIERL